MHQKFESYLDKYPQYDYQGYLTRLDSVLGRKDLDPQIILELSKYFATFRDAMYFLVKLLVLRTK